MTPLLLARWKRQAERGRELSVMHKMAVRRPAGCRVLSPRRGGRSGQRRRSRPLALAAVLLPASSRSGELYILPNGLGIFARLAPPKLGASTVAAWYFAIFAGSLLAGQVGRLWSHVGHVGFFVLLAAIASAAAALLYLLDGPTRVILARAGRGADERDLTDVPEGIARRADA